MVDYRSARDLDWPLLILTLAISALGVLQIYSATLGTRDSQDWVKQSVFIFAGLAAMYLASRFDYHVLLEHSFLLYSLSLLMLTLVLLFGRKGYGSRRWIPLPGGFNLQVSELAKLVLVLLVARYLSELRTDRPGFGDIVKLGVLVALPMALVMKQPDLGTSLTYAAVLAAGVFFSGLRWRVLVVLVLVAALAVPLSWPFLSDYQKARVTSFYDPSSDPLGSGFQVLQSMIAVGSGGMWGKGVAQGSQTQLLYLPVAHKDFVLSSFAEEHGFFLVAVVLLLYFLMLMRIVQNAQAAPDRAGMYICMGIAALLLFQTSVNVGMLVGRMIVTGLPLPLMSYGGSNVLTTFLMLGLVNNVRLQRFVN
jgi:rod shape determining protein RodA